MPISSGAGGRAARLHLVNSSGGGGGGGGGKSRTYLTNTVANTAIKAHSTSALYQSNLVVSSRPSGGTGSGHGGSSGTLSSSSVASNISQQRLASPGGGIRAVSKIEPHKTGMVGSNSKRAQTSGGPIEKYKQIRHISPPSSNATTSSTAFKYFAPNSGLGSSQGASEFANLARDKLGDVSVTNQATSQEEIVLSKQDERIKRSKRRRNKIMSSLGGQLVVTGGGQGHSIGQSITNGKLVSGHSHLASATQQQSSKPPNGGGGGGLFSSLMMLAGGGGGGSRGQKATTSELQQQQQHSQQGQQSHNYAKATTTTTTATAINQQQHHNNSQNSLNPSLSGFVSTNRTLSSSSLLAGNNVANLHSLASLHDANLSARSTQALTTPMSISTSTSTSTKTKPTIINKRINLKYVKTLIILLMSLDLAITLFVHYFASHDEFSLILTQHKLRFSLVNLVLSAIWYMVLAAAILFDIYVILLIGVIVDIGSLILLLVCSVIHFTHRIDYNTVNLTSLLLLLFSIIVLHVYLIVIAALTIYLMMAVKRRKKH